MKVKVLFFAGLREQLGTAAEEIELPAGVNTVCLIRWYSSDTSSRSARPRR